MKKIVIFAILLCCSYSCHDVDTYNSKIIVEPACCVAPPILHSRLRIRLVDSNKNWTKSVDDKNLKLVIADENWVTTSDGEEVQLSRNKDNSLESASINFLSDKEYGQFKLKRNQNTEDKIICIYKDFDHGKRWGKILTVIIYNGKEYIVNNENLDDADHDKDFVVTPIDIVVE